MTGEVAVNLAAVNEGMVAGDAVNTAARIQGAAAPGSVWVDGATRRLTANAISYHDEGAHPLKGKAEPERLWRAVRVVSSVGGVQRVDGLEAPLTGRGAEMRALRESVPRVCGASRAAVGGGVGPGRGGQVAAGLGVREVRGRVGRRGVVASRSVSVLWRRFGVSGRWRR